MVEMLPEIEVVEDDAFNSDPRDPKNMGPDALQRLKAGEELPVAHVPTPLVRNAGRTVCCPHAGFVVEMRGRNGTGASRARAVRPRPQRWPCA